MKVQPSFLCLAELRIPKGIFKALLFCSQFPALLPLKHLLCPAASSHSPGLAALRPRREQRPSAHRPPLPARAGCGPREGGPDEVPGTRDRVEAATALGEGFQWGEAAWTDGGTALGALLGISP